jgi:carotenoid 1,2-hydratase
LSDDGLQGLTIIGFIGSVFSPYYAWARRRNGGVADPLDHCAVNVALYGKTRGNGRWAMTERKSASVGRDSTSLQIGKSSLRWEGAALVIDIDEVTAPVPSRLRGQVRVYPQSNANRSFGLDASGRHRWQPIAPRARVEVAFVQPGCRWEGSGYLDSNHGDRPLEADFVRWDWSRSALTNDRCAVLYDVTHRDGSNSSLTLNFDASGDVTPFEAKKRTTLPRSGWHIERVTRSDAGASPTVRRGFEDAPFYARTLLDTRLLGEKVTAVHESLSLDRFATPWCHAMLPFRMPRALWS